MRKKSGFTIIEVALVLAIAGMILLLAFIAIPGLQRSQRDSRRKDDMMKLADSIKKFQSNNNRGALPNATQLEENVLNSFLGGSNNFKDPDNTSYKLVYADCTKLKKTAALCNDANDAAPTKHNMVFAAGANCNEDNQAIKSANQRKGAILYQLESGSVFCYEL